MRNYRPIPLLLLFPQYPKCYAQHLHTNNILINEEFGFRKGIPTETATFRTTDCVLKCVTKKYACGRNILWLCESWNSQHLHTNNKLINEQYGFRKGIPTETATFRTTDCVLKCVTKKKCMWEEYSVIMWIMKFC